MLDDRRVISESLLPNPVRGRFSPFRPLPGLFLATLLCTIIQEKDFII